MTVTVTPQHERKVAEEVHARNKKKIKAAHSRAIRGGYDKLTGSAIANWLRDVADAYDYMPVHCDAGLEDAYADQKNMAEALYELAASAEHGVHHARKAIIKESHPWADPAHRHLAFTWNVYMTLLMLGDGYLDRASRLVAADFGIPGTLNVAARKVGEAYLDCFKGNPRWLAEIRMPRTFAEAAVSHSDPMEEWLMNGCLEKVPAKDVVNPLTTEEWAILMPHLRNGDIVPWLRGRGGAIRKKWFTAGDAKALERDPTNWLIPGARAVPWELIPGLTLKAQP
jgi:hypothetical protein